MPKQKTPKKRFPHHCSFCDRNWQGYKKEIVQCIYCHRYLKVPPKGKKRKTK